MLLSIIIPVYNVEKYIAQNITSILNSDSSEDIEIILVDDGSTDNSLSICRNYEAKYKNIKCLTEDKRGPGKARNFGLSVASGKWIYFVDADDFINTDGMKALIAYLSKNNCHDLVLFNVLSYYESSGTYELFAGSQYSIKDNGKSGADFFTNVLKRDVSYGYCAIFYMVRRSVISKHKILFDEKGLANDSSYSIKIWNYAKNVAYIDRDIYIYRREQPSSITHNPNPRWVLSVLKRVETNLEFIDSEVESKEFAEYLKLSCFNLYMVAMSTFSRFDRSTQSKYISIFEKLRKPFIKIEKTATKRMQKKIKILLFLNKTIPTNIFINAWSVYYWLRQHLEVRK